MRSLLKLSWAALLLAVAAPASADDVDVMKILKDVDATTKNVKAVSYKAEAWVQDPAGKRMRPIKAAVKLQARERSEEPPMFAVEGEANDGDEAMKFQAVYNGKDLMIVDSEIKKVKIMKMDEAEQETGPFQMVWMREFTHPTPFTDEINADKQTYEGKKSINGVECHVILVKYKGMPQEARWFFGVEDKLPHRVERMMEGRPGAQVMELADVKTVDSFDEKTFAVKAPEGYEDDSPGLLRPGRPAPDWTLKDADGKDVSLKDLKGKVVVLDFWATWCGPCKKAMPLVQKLHETYKDKGLVVFGANCWENKDKDPAAFMKENGYTYGLLLKADDVAKAYRVKGIPTFYVIGKDGKIVYSAVGLAPERETDLEETIKTALK